MSPTNSLFFRFPLKFFWLSFATLLLHLTSSARIDSNYASTDRQPRQNSYRGNYRFQVPSYLNPDAYARTVYSTDNRGSDGSFNYEYETDNAIKVKQESTGYGANKVVRGYYSYIGSDGVPYSVNYIADRYGYRAYGAHLPTQPDAVFDQSKLPVYRPINRPHYESSSVPSQVYPLQPPNSQYQTQSVYAPQTSLASQPIYVAPGSGSPNYISITPKPSDNRIPTSTPPTLSILPPYNNFVSSSPQYSNQPYTWTTAKQPNYNGAYNTNFQQRPF